MVSGHHILMTNEQANEMVLAWCRRERLDGVRPVMRTYMAGPACRVIDASMFEPAILASGSDWIQVAGLLGVYGPQADNTPAPVVRSPEWQTKRARRSFYTARARR